MKPQLAESRVENKRVVFRARGTCGIDVTATAATLFPRAASRAFPVNLRLPVVALLLLASARGAPPAPLASAIEYLRDQKSYSWEVINADPGPVAQQFETRRGTVTTVQQNLSPNVKGTIDRQGDMLIQREWADGLRLDTIITTDGAMVTRTPEGWMTDREILTAQAEERMSGKGATPRAVWLRRADRPDIRRPDQELTPLLKTAATFSGGGDSYRVTAEIPAPGAGSSSGEASAPPTRVSITMNLRGGLIRDYEVKIEATRAVTRARVQVPVSDQRIVVVKYLPVTRIDIPSEAAAKLRAGKPPAGRRERSG